MEHGKKDRKVLCSVGPRGMVAALKFVGRRAERDARALFSISGPVMPIAKRMETASHHEARYRVFARHLRRAASSFDEAADVLLEGRSRLSPQKSSNP